MKTNLNKFKTTIDEQGRVCTKCLTYKTWDNFATASKSKTKKTADCKECKSNNKKQTTKNYSRINYCARKNKQKIKKEQPLLYKARLIRSSLLRRVKDAEIKKQTPTVDEILKWLEINYPFYCYYSYVALNIDKIVVDHKVPIARGGTNILNNLCICSHHMNTAKGTMTDLEFKQLLCVIEKWEDKGEKILKRLKQGWF